MAVDSPLSSIRAANENYRREAALPPGGDGGHDGGMPPDDRVSKLEKQVAALEGKVDGLAADMRAVKADTQKLREDVAEIKGRLTNMPTLFQIQTWFFGVSLGLVALVFTIARAMK